MNWWHRVKQVFYSVTGYAVGATSGYFGGILEGFSGAWQRNIVLPPKENLLAFSAVYSCVDLIARDVAKLRIKLMSQSGVGGIWTEVVSAAFSPVLRKPNKFQTRIQFLMLWVIQKLLYGNAYIFKVRDNRNVVVAMYVLDARRVVPQITEEGEVYYQVNVDLLSGVMVQQYLPASEVIHDRGPCLFHPLVGVSPIYAAASSAAQGIRIQQNASTFFENMSRPSGVLTSPSTIDQATADRMKAQFDENFQGGRLGKLLVAGDGLKYEPMTIPAADSQLIEQLGWTGKDIANCFHVPIYKLGGPMPTHTTVAALNQDYYNQCLQEYIESIELLLDEGLGLTLVTTATYGTELDLDGLLRMDQTSLMSTLKEGVAAGIMSPNEARRRVDLPPVDGGEGPYLQQQNYSLAALAKRDAKTDPFETASPSVAPQPSNVPALPPPSQGGKSVEEQMMELSILIQRGLFGEDFHVA